MQSIYKFRDWENDHHKEILCDQEFYCASIADFNDPFDSRIPINYMDLTDAERIEVVEEHVRRNHPTLIGKDRICKVEEVFRKSAITDPDELKKNYQEVVIPQLEDEIGVISFAGNRRHILLWSHYADGHKGFCVGIDRDRLQEWVKQLLTEEDMYIEIFDVNYEGEYPSLNPLDLSLEEYYALPLTTKAEEWRYEDEVRLLFRGGAERKLNMDTELFTEIIIGCNMEYDHKQEILSVMESEFDNLPVYEASMAEFEFALNFERIA